MNADNKGLPISLRHGYLEDAQQISDIHRSYVDRWYRKIGNGQFDVPYGALSLSERWGFGGPWMSVETCSIHLNYLLLNNHIPIVAQQGDLLVGEMELFMGQEGPPFGKNLHIGLLYVRKGFTGQGIGKALVDKAIEIAKKQECDTVTVTSSQANEGFYEKCGFERSGTMVEAEAATKAYDVKISRMKPPMKLASFTRGMPMRLGRHQSSAYHIFEQAVDYAIPEFMLNGRNSAFMKVNGHSSLLAFLEFDAEPSRADVYAWSREADAFELAAAALTTLHNRGIKYANMLMTAEDYGLMADRLDVTVKGSRSILLRYMK
ncbi:Putative acetyltransferase [Methanocella conradii HZ254]|uniref:Acetyltransferase n=1 Tax=Methanocella conradii (strain DSM 24694 / JCM 17849 / CGMCC 1.5162 / HZ254) TaxID=1041930 RepID=H8I9R8_METCZ|nr:GNAT family N-acetyltransferase [Methanocella conradii]AFD00519.1 Putative acetyltransferase [Methanocella conradii HZ254]